MKTDYQSFFESAVEGIFRSTPGGKLITANPAMAALFRYTSPLDLIDGITDIGTQMYADPKDRKKIIRLLKQDGKVEDFEILCLRKDGSTFWVSLNVRAVKDKNGRINFYEGFMRDIDQRKRAEKELEQFQADLEQKVAERTAELEQENLRRAQVEQALRESETRYRNLVDYSTSIVLEWDTRGKIVFLNQYGLDFFGFKEKEILGHNVVGTMVKPVDSSGYDLQGKMLVVQEHPEDFYSSENENVKKNGEKVWIAWTNKGIYGEDGKLVKTLSVGIDRTRQRKIEEQLIQSTEINRLALEISQAGTWEWDLVGNILNWSPEFRKVLRMKKNLTPSLESWRQSVHPADRESFTERIQAAIDARADLLIDHRIQLPKKEVRWIRMTGKTFLEDDQPVRMLGLCLDVTAQKQAEQALLESRDQLERLVVQRTRELVAANQHLQQDITERKQSEEALRENESRFRAFIEQSPIAIGVFHLDGSTLFANQKFVETLGFQKIEQLIRRPAFDFFAPSYREESKERTRRRLQGLPVPSEYESTALRADTGLQFPVHLAVAPIQLPSGTVSIAFLTDITERKLAEEALRESEERYKSLFKNSHAAMLVVDPETTAILDANPAATTYYGWTREELLKKRVDQINTLSPKEVREEMKQARTEKRHQFLFKHRRADGSMRDVEVFSSPLVLQGKTLLYSIIHDVTERKQVEEALQVSEQAARETASQVQMVNQIGEKINAGLGFKQLLQTIHTQCQQIGETHTFYVAIYDENTDLISFPYFYKDGEQKSIAPRKIRENSGLAGHIIQTRKTVYLPDESIMPEGVKPVRTTGIHTQSFVGVPLILGEKVVGVLSMQSNSLNAYTSGQVHTLELLATQAAIAIQNSQLYEQARVEQDLATTLAEQLRIVNQISLKITSGLGYDQLMQTIYQQCLQIGFADTFYVGLYDQTTDLFKLPVYFSDGKAVYRPPVHLKENPGIASHVIARQQSIYVPDIHNMPPGIMPHTISPTPTRTRTYLGIPLLLNEQVIGVLSMQSTTPDAYSPAQIHTLELLATQLAIAIQNSQLFEQVEGERILANALIENLPGAVGLIDQHANLLRWNKKAESITGYSPEEIIGLDFISIFSQEDQMRLPELIARVFNEGWYSTDLQLNAKDGRQIPFYVTGARVHLGNEDQLLFIAMDITERKQAEQALAESQALAAAIVESTADLIWSVDCDHFGLLTFNHGLSDYFLSTRDMHIKIGDTPEVLFPPGDYVKFWTGSYQRALREGSYSVEYSTYSGSRTLQLTFNLLKREDKVFGVSVFGRDITERKKMEQDILQNEAIFSSFMENSPVYVFFKDRDIRALRLSRNFDQMLGIPVDQALGKTMDELFPSELAKSMLADDLRILHEGQKVDVVEEMNGRIYETTKFPIFKDGKPDMLAGFTIDVTERKQAEQALREAEAFNQAIITNSPIGISVRSSTGELLSANAAWLKIWGIRDKEFQVMLQEKFTELQFDERDENLKPHQEQVRQVYEKGGSLNLPELKTRYRRPGDAEWVSQYYYAIADDQGQVSRVVTLTEDISARKQAEAEIIKSRALLERVQEVAHLGSWEIDLKTSMVTASDEACRIYGVKIGTLTLANVQVIPLEEYRPVLDAALAALIKGEAEYNLEFRIQRIADGAIRDIHSVAEYNRENNTVIGSIQDITERKAAERELKEQLDLLERMNNVMVDRELRMLEIKKEVNALLAKAGEKEKYRIFEL